MKTNFDFWKSVELGIYKNADELCKVLRENGFLISDWAKDILTSPTFTVASLKEEIQLVNISVGELGFENEASYGDICDKAKEIGLELCPNEVGPQLRLQYKNQQKGESICIAMEPVIDSEDTQSLFRLTKHNDDADGIWLYGEMGHSGNWWNADQHFIFCVHK